MRRYYVPGDIYKITEYESQSRPSWKLYSCAGTLSSLTSLAEFCLWCHGGNISKPTQAQLPWQLESNYSPTSPAKQIQIGTAWLLMHDYLTGGFCLQGLWMNSSTLITMIWWQLGLGWFEILCPGCLFISKLFSCLSGEITVYPMGGAMGGGGGGGVPPSDLEKKFLSAQRTVMYEDTSTPL